MHTAASSNVVDLLPLPLVCWFMKNPKVRMTLAWEMDQRSSLGTDFAEEDSSDEEFHYPAPIITSSSRSGASTPDYFSRASGSRIPTDLTPALSQAPDFRVPTHEAPQKVLSPRWTEATPHHLHAQWERDESVSSCRECARRFNFLNRRVSNGVVVHTNLFYWSSDQHVSS